MAGVCCFRIPAVTEVGAGMRSTTGPVTVTQAGRGRDATPTSMRDFASFNSDSVQTLKKKLSLEVWIRMTPSSLLDEVETLIEAI